MITVTDKTKLENILSQAYTEYAEEKLKNEPFNEEEFKTSKSFEKKMNKMIKSERSIYHRLTLTRTRKILLIAAIITALLLSSLSVSAVRNFVANLFVTEHSNHNTLIANIEDGNYPKRLEELYEIKNIPKGYKLTSKEVTENSAEYIYNDNKDSLIFSQMTKDGFIGNWDNKHSDHSARIYKGQEYYIINYDNGEKIIIWDNGKYIFNLSAKVPEKTLFSLCDSLKVKTN